MADRPRVDSLEGFLRRLFDLRGDDVESVVLFGSMARGDWSLGSDFDVLVVLRRDPGQRWTHLLLIQLEDRDFVGQERQQEEQGRAAIGARIRQVRESIGLSQSEAARKCKVGRVTLNRIEQGGQTPSYDTLRKLSEAFGVPIRRLLLD